MKRILTHTGPRLCAALIGLSAAAVAHGSVAATIRFDNVTTNNAQNVDIGRNQLKVDIGNDIGGGAAFGAVHQVRFTFHNIGTYASAITDVYFDDGSLLGPAFIESTPGVNFSFGADPANLPGGENAVPPFMAIAAFSSQANPPDQTNGVNPGETLRIVFDLQPGRTIPDVVEELTSGELRVGIHMQGFEVGGIESFVNLPAPEPTSLLPLLLAFAFRRR